MATIHHQIGVDAPLLSVFEALATTEGVSKWWSRCEGNAEQGGKFEMHFGDYVMPFTVASVVPSELVRWKPQLEAAHEWSGTAIEFALANDGKQTLIRFKHEDWRQPTDFFGHCSTKWAVFLISLKQMLETGEGRPHPNDIHINVD